MMTYPSKWFQCGLASLTLVLSVAAAPVPDNEIATLEAELTSVGKAKSAVEQRLTCKSVIRQGKALFEAHPEAPNRFRVLGIVFQGQKRLLGLENSDRNRSELFDTCQRLAEAPDEFAEMRLEADLLLSDRNLTAKDAGLRERALALRAIIERYRGTTAEAKSLMMAAMIAPKLEANDLEDEISTALTERFASNPEVIEFIQKNLGLRRVDALFSGVFTRGDGTVIHFPSDRLGHLSLIVFWSKETPGFEQFLKQVQTQHGPHAGMVQVFSFNVDELPDSGAAILRGLGLDWTVMRLPGGRKSAAFQTYVQKDPAGILVNAYSRVVLAPSMERKDQFKIDAERIAEERYLAQLQSLFIGDFLVTDSVDVFDLSLPPELKMISLGADSQPSTGLKRAAESVPAETLRAIQDCFTLPPLRYRLTKAEALANYTKAEKLIREAIQQSPKAPDLWVARNRRIISLLGMWNLGGEPKHLEEAIAESRTALAVDAPPAAGVVPRFCLAKQTLRLGHAKPEVVLSTLIQETGADRAPASAYAAASILALDAQSKELHEYYRGKFMEAPYDGNPALWPFISFLRDRYHRYSLLKGSLTRSEDQGARRYIINFGSAPTTDRLPTIELKTLDGKTLILPKDNQGKLTLLVFIEPPETINKEVELDAKRRPKKMSNGIMDRAVYLAANHVNKELKLVPAFLCDDPEKVKAMMEVTGWNCEPVMVPGGLANPMVQRLGILSADHINNVFVLRRDGAIAWQTSGFSYKADLGGGPFAMTLAMKVHIETCEAETAYEALKQGEFRKAASVFSGPFPPENDERFQWAAPRLHGRALAHMGLKEWDAALADIDAAMKAHYNKGEIRERHSCEVIAELRLIRATLLDQLGRKEEAEAERKLAALAAVTEAKSPYSVFHAKLTALRREQH